MSESTIRNDNERNINIFARYRV